MGYRIRKDEAGAELAEFAVVLPLLMMTVVAIFWFGRAYNIYETLTRAAREGARYGAASYCTLCKPGCSSGTDDFTGFPCSGDIANNKVIPALQADHLDPNALLKLPAPSLPSCAQDSNAPPSCKASGPTCDSWNGGRIWVCYCVDMNPSGPPSECGVSVSLKYPFTFPIPFTGLNQVGIPATVQMRQEF